MTRFTAALSVLVLAGCADSAPPGPDLGANQATGGAYIGQITPPGAATPDALIGLVDETGFGYFIDTDAGVVYNVQTTTEGLLLSGSYRAYQPPAPAITGTLSGAALSRNTLSGFATSSAGNIPFSLTYQAAAYEQPASLPLIAGDYALSANGVFLSATVTGDGAVSTTDSEGCVFTGAFTIPDLRYNAYRLAGTYQCAGFPDQTISGIASFQPASGPTPATLSVIASDGGDFAVAGSAERF